MALKVKQLADGKFQLVETKRHGGDVRIFPQIFTSQNEAETFLQEQVAQDKANQSVSE